MDGIMKSLNLFGHLEIADIQPQQSGVLGSPPGRFELSHWFYCHALLRLLDYLRIGMSLPKEIGCFTQARIIRPVMHMSKCSAGYLQTWQIWEPSLKPRGPTSDILNILFLKFLRLLRMKRAFLAQCLLGINSKVNKPPRLFQHIGQMSFVVPSWCWQPSQMERISANMLGHCQKEKCLRRPNCVCATLACMNRMDAKFSERGWRCCAVMRKTTKTKWTACVLANEFQSPPRDELDYTEYMLWLTILLPRHPKPCLHTPPWAVYWPWPLPALVLQTVGHAKFLSHREVLGKLPCAPEGVAFGQGFWIHFPAA